MPSVELSERLRPHRKDLVLAAEATFKGYNGKLPDKAQFSRLVTVCGEASCAEEIRNYLRYQSSRDRAPWDEEFARVVLKGIEGVLAKPELASDEARVEAWKLFATFLSRAFTYEKACRTPAGAGAPPPPQGARQDMQQGQQPQQGRKHHGR